MDPVAVGRAASLSFMESSSYGYWNVLPVVIQCFDKESLVYLKEKTSLALIQLIDVPDKFDQTVIAEVATYASGIGKFKVPWQAPTLFRFRYFITLNCCRAIQSISGRRFQVSG